MIDGLKLAMRGDEVTALLNERIERLRAIIGIKLDAIAGNAPPPRTDYVTQVPAEVVDDEIRQHEHRIRVLTMVRDHILGGETYLIGRKDLEFADLLPEPPSTRPDSVPEEIRWVTHPVDVSAAMRGAGCPGD